MSETTKHQQDEAILSNENRGSEKEHNDFKALYEELLEKEMRLQERLEGEKQQKEYYKDVHLRSDDKNMQARIELQSTISKLNRQLKTVNEGWQESESKLRKDLAQSRIVIFCLSVGVLVLAGVIIAITLS